MGVEKFAKKTLSKGPGKPGPKKESTPIAESFDKVIAIGEAIVDLDDEIGELESKVKDLQDRLAATKMGQQLAAIRADLAEKRKQISTFEKDAIPLIKIVDPEHRRVPLPSGATLVVETKAGSKSSANTLTNLKAILGSDEAAEYWEKLEPKETEALIIEVPA